MRLCRIKASAASSSSSASTKSTSRAATETAGSAKAGTATRSSNHHASEHSCDCVCDISGCAALLPRARHGIFYTLTNLILVEVRKPVCLAHLSAYRD